tara:strand:+ start:1914 stop:3149 length:1236 start_codon:yes stop_codon:yes gene_type:complete
MGVLDFGQATRKVVQAAATPGAQDVAATAVTPPAAAAPPPAAAAPPPVAPPAIPSEPDPVEPPPVEPTPEPEPEPVAVEGDLDELNKRADALELEIKNLQSSVRGQAPVKLRATIEEREMAQLEKDEATQLLSAKRGELRQVLEQIESLSGVAEPAKAPSAPPPGVEFDEKRGPVYPGRSRERSQEKLIEAETGARTIEQTQPGIYEYFSSGPEMREVELPIEGEEPRVYARSRKRQAMKQLFDPRTGGVALNNPLGEALIKSPARLGIAAGQSVYDQTLGSGDKPTADSISPESLRAPFSSGVMFAPRAPMGQQFDADKTGEKLSVEILSRKRNIRGANSRLTELQDSIGDTSRPGDIYAEIEALKDEKEQMQAELNQLLRIKDVTIPRREAEEESEPEKHLLGDFASQF